MEEFQTDRLQHETSIVHLQNGLDKVVQRVQTIETQLNRIVSDRPSSSIGEDASTLQDDVELAHRNLRVMFAKIAITEAELDGPQVQEAHRDQRLLGLLHDISSRLTPTENYAFNMNEMMHAQQAVIDPQLPDLPVISHRYWGFIVPAERPPTWTVHDRSFNLGVITQVTEGLQPYNPSWHRMVKKLFKKKSSKMIC
eukprot:1812738-Amphidinium_carterae.1